MVNYRRCGTEVPRDWWRRSAQKTARRSQQQANVYTKHGSYGKKETSNAFVLE